MKAGVLAVEQAAETAAGRAATLCRWLDAALGGLHEHPALAAERHLDRLAGAAADEVLHLEVGADAGRHARGPGDRGLGVGERRRRADVEQDGRAVGEDRHEPGPVQRQVEQAGAHHRAGALDALDVPVDAGVEGEQVAAVDRDVVVLEVDQVDVLRLVGEEYLTGAADLLQLRALAGHRHLEHPPDAARAGVLERHVALVGDHRAEPGLDRHLVEAHLEQLRVLQREGVLRLDLPEFGERILHPGVLWLDESGARTIAGLAPARQALRARAGAPTTAAARTARRPPAGPEAPTARAAPRWRAGRRRSRAGSPEARGPHAPVRSPGRTRAPRPAWLGRPQAPGRRSRRPHPLPRSGAAGSAGGPRSARRPPRPSA